MKFLKNYSRFVGQVSSLRQPSIIRELLKILSTASPEMIPLSGGLPNPAMFPFKSFNVTLKNGAKISLTGESMGAALQYLPTNGHDGLLGRLRDLQGRVHGDIVKSHLDSGRYDVVTSNGSQDGLSKSLEMMANEGDSVVVEDHTFFATLSILDPLKAKYVTVDTDSQGMRPESLWQALSSRYTPGDPAAPKFLYTNPTGANPCGTVLPIDRKRDIYNICCEYDMVIVEDDPYYYMQFGEEREQSFLSIDRQCRVIRLDSFSKIMSSGIRLGFITGPKPLVDKIVLHMQVSVLHASALSQVLVNEMLKEWGYEGFMKHVEEIESFYKRRRDLMHAAASKHLDGLCEWALPQGGMFLWIRVDGVDDTWHMIMEEGLKRNIMLVPGRVFVPQSADGRKSSPFLRASYSLADTDKFDEAFRRLAGLIREEQEKTRLRRQQQQAVVE